MREALESTTDNKQRVHATIAAYYDFVDGNGGAFRLVFESDLTSQDQVRERVDSANRRCADLVTKVIAEDAGLSPARVAPARCRAHRPGPGQRPRWTSTDSKVPRDVAVSLISTLAWRGIRGFPRKG